MTHPSRHIGADVTALVDEQLSPEDSERAWRHVLGCSACRRLVQCETWTKSQLGFLAGPHAAPSPGLLGSLYAVDAWAEVDHIEEQSRRRRSAGALVGGGAAVGLAVAGLLALSTPPAGVAGLSIPGNGTTRQTVSPGETAMLPVVDVNRSAQPMRGRLPR